MIVTLWINAKAGLVRLWKTSALIVRQALVWVTDERRNQVGQSDLLHPRCCRTEQYWESQ
jgi:hypothetical protein